MEAHQLVDYHFLHLNKDLLLEELTRPGMLRALVDRGGLRADVILSGEISIGDAVVPLR